MKLRPIHAAALLAAVFISAPVRADTPTETATATATPTPTHTPVVVSTPTAVATLTPIPGPQTTLLPPNPQARGGLMVTDGNIRVVAHSSGNAGKIDQIIGAPRCKNVAFGTMTNGSTETTLYTDDSPDGEWTAIDANNVTVSADTGVYKVGAKSLKLAFGGNATTGDGALNDIVNDDLEADEHIGFWINPSEGLSGGDLRLEVRDTTDSTYYLIPAVAPNVWTWVDIEITDLASGRGNVVDKVGIELTAQGDTNHNDFSVYLDAMYKWDAADEETLSVDVVEDSLQTIMAIPTTPGTSNTPVVLDLYTDFFVAYRVGADSIVTITNQSANSGWATVCYK